MGNPVIWPHLQSERFLTGQILCVPYLLLNEAASLLGAALSFPHGSGTSPVARGGSYRG